MWHCGRTSLCLNEGKNGLEQAYFHQCTHASTQCFAAVNRHVFADGTLTSSNLLGFNSLHFQCLPQIRLFILICSLPSEKTLWFLVFLELELLRWISKGSKYLKAAVMEEENQQPDFPKQSTALGWHPPKRPHPPQEVGIGTNPWEVKTRNPTFQCLST